MFEDSDSMASIPEPELDGIQYEPTIELDQLLSATFKKRFEHILQFKTDDKRRVACTEAISCVFSQLAAQIECHLHEHLERFVQSIEDRKERACTIDSMTKSILVATTIEHLKKFISTYIIVRESEQTYKPLYDLVLYLKSADFLTKHLKEATHLDVKDIISALKKCVLKCLSNLSQLEATIKSKSCKSLLEKLCNYEWVSKLSSIQDILNECIKEQSCTREKLSTHFYIDIPAQDYTSIEEQYLYDYLTCYGIIEYATEKDMQGRVIATFQAANLSFRDALTFLNDENFDEVQFICTECLYLDASTDRTWKSKNVAIHSAKIIVTTECTIDVSGHDGVHGKDKDEGKEKAKSATPLDEPGKGSKGYDGEHGDPGGCGGNIVIIADEIIDAQLLTLKSCGGKGGDGQNGGNGGNGKATPGDEEDLRDEWPKNFADYFSGSPKAVHSRIKAQMNTNGYQIKEEVDRPPSTTDHVVNKGIKIVGGLFKFLVMEVATPHLTERLNDISIYSESKSGVRLLFSFFDGLGRRYGFLLSLSKDGYSADGGDAGIGGKGGQGGRAGKVEIIPTDRNIKIERNNGKNGETGKSGQAGKPEFVKRLSDYLIVDAGAGGMSKTYPRASEHPVFIEVVDGRESHTKDESNQLGSGEYHCFHDVTKEFDSSLSTDMLCFFKKNKSKYYLTKSGTKAKEGEVKEQTNSKVESDFQVNTPIDKEPVKAKYIKLQVKQHRHLKENIDLSKELIAHQRSLENQLHEKNETGTYHRKRHHTSANIDPTTSKVKIDVSNMLAVLQKPLENQSEQVWNHDCNWDLLLSAHQKLVATSQICDRQYQLKAVKIHKNISDRHWIDCNHVLREIENIAQYLDKIEMHEYESVCKSTLPFTPSTIDSLEIVMVLINHFNRELHLCLPDILSAVEKECKTFQRTICELDLHFVINFIQENLLSLTALEDKFCQPILSIETHNLEDYSFLLCTKKLYEISKVIVPSKSEIQIILGECTDIETGNKSNTDEPNTEPTILTLRHDGQIFLNNDSQTPDTVFVAQFEVHKLWVEVDQLLANGLDEKSLEETLTNIGIVESYKDDIRTTLKRASLALDLPFDVFTFYPPSQWVEQLLIYALRKKYPDDNLANAHQAISGLSQCTDKTLYYHFFSQYLWTESVCGINEIIEMLQDMQYIFINSQLCTLITPRGIANICDESLAQHIFDDLEENGLITQTGLFQHSENIKGLEDYQESDSIEGFENPDITKQLKGYQNSDIEDYQDSDTIEELDLEDHKCLKRYLEQALMLQQFCHSLENKEAAMWRYKLSYLKQHLIIKEALSNCNLDNDALKKIQEMVTIMLQLYNNEEVLHFILELQKTNTSVSILKAILTQCIASSWIFQIACDKLKQKCTPKEIEESIRCFDVEKEESQDCKVDEIMVNLSSQFDIDIHSHFQDIARIVHEVKETTKFSSIYRTDDCKISQYTEQDIMKWSKRFRTQRKKINKGLAHDPLFTEMFTVICQAVHIFYKNERKKEGIFPRHTQMVASLLFFMDPLCTQMMQQIATGEGKTMVVSMTAIMKVLLGEKVDIVTSSSVLAKRDASEQEPLYEYFGITVKHCCHQELTRRKNAYKAEVVYGDAASFQRDILETDFYNKQIRSSRPYANVVIDEVDSMLLDKGETILYLPHAVPQLSSLEFIYLEIWSIVNDENFFGFPSEQDEIYDALKCKLFAGIPPMAFTAIPGVTEEMSEIIHKECQKAKLLDTEYYVPSTKSSLKIRNQLKSIKSVPQEKIEEFVLIFEEYIGCRLPVHPEVFAGIKGINLMMSERIHSCLQKIELIDSDSIPTTADIEFVKDKITEEIDSKTIPESCREDVISVFWDHLEQMREPLCSVPKELHPFIKKNLRSWIQSAVTAKFFEPNKQYIIDIDRQETASDRFPRIIIMDNETGVEQESSEWSNGLHQFLQLKHHLRLSTESLKAVYMSNISFFTKYHNVMGVTGTLGSIEECHLFKNLYNKIKLVQLPTNRPSRLQMNTPQCFKTEKEWLEEIEKEVVNLISPDKATPVRAVLLICEDVHTANQFFHFFDSKKLYDISLYIRSYDLKPEELGEILPGKLIIATNLAGRGTDIKLSELLIENGGLHVCLSYLPPNMRVQQQAFGRAARAGQPGSCRMIFYNNDDNDDLCYVIHKRDLVEAQRIADISTDYKYNISLQEDLFETFSAEYHLIEGEKVTENMYLDSWAFLLDEYTDTIEHIPKLSSESERAAQRECIKTQFKLKLKQQLSNKHQSYSRLIELGHSYMKQAVKKNQSEEYKDAKNKVELEKALDAYQRARKLNPSDPFARYYECAARLNKQFRFNLLSGKASRRQLKKELYRLIPMLQERINACKVHVQILNSANRHHDQSLTEGALYYAKQKEHEIEMYMCFIQSMQNVVGHELTPDMFHYLNWSKDTVTSQIKDDATINQNKDDAGMDQKKDDTVIVLEMVKKMLNLKDFHISHKQHTPRLSAMLQANPAYHTFQGRIKDVVEYLKGKKSVTEDDFKSVLPNKEVFWDGLVQHGLVTNDTGTPDDTTTDNWYLCPEKFSKLDIDFDDCDTITSDSFKWIPGLPNPDGLVEYLIKHKVLDESGKLIQLDLSHPLTDLPQEYTPYYRLIKDTLRNHGIYHYALDHLHQCVIIDKLTEVCKCSHAIAESVVDVVKQINPDVYQSDILHVNHLEPSSESKYEPIELPLALSDHIPTKEMNKAMLEQLLNNNLFVTEVSGAGLNCLINALIQHAKEEYGIGSFPEADAIREQLLKKKPKSTGMLHADDPSAKLLLELVNDYCPTTGNEIGVVSAIIASSSGPIIYCGTSDERYASTGRHVVIWQQGNHFVSVFALPPTLQLSSHQFNILCNQGAIKQTENYYHICFGLKTLGDIECEGLTIHDKERIIKFIQSKLSVDKLTLRNFPMHLISNQHISLFDHLCQYAVIKPVKVKLDNDDISDICCSTFGSKSQWISNKAHFDTTFLNPFLKHRDIPELTPPQTAKLLQFLEQEEIISADPASNLIKCFRYLLVQTENESESTKLRQDLHEMIQSIDSGVHDVDTCLECLEDLIDPTTARTLLKDFQGSKHYNIKVEDLRSLKLPKISFLDTRQHEGVKNYVQLMISLRENSSTLISSIQATRSSLLDLDNPEITLRKLSDVFADGSQEKGDVLEKFLNNQFHFVINVAEKKWSLKSIVTAVSAMVFGVAQIALGVSLLAVTAGTGVYFCQVLISEGASDIMFGIQGLASGYCTPSDYIKHKLVSVAISLATAGIGAWLGRGVQVSKYGYKAFGEASKEALKIATKEFGKMAFRKIIAREVGKKILKEVGMAVANALVGLGADVVMQKFHALINRVSSQIVDMFSTVLTSDTQLASKMQKFLQQNPNNPEESLHQVTMKILQTLNFVELWDKLEDMFQNSADIVVQGHEQAAEHQSMHGKTLPGKSVMKAIAVISKFLPLILDFLKSSQILLSVTAIKDALINKLDEYTEDNSVPDTTAELKVDQKLNDDDENIIVKEISAIKEYFTQQISERAQRIVRTTIHITGQHLMKRAITFGKKIYLKAKNKRDELYVKTHTIPEMDCIRKQGGSDMQSRLENCRREIISCTRSPKVIAALIKNHDAMLGPPSIPALEELYGRKIVVVDKNDNPHMSVQHSSQKGPPIKVIFDPETAHFTTLHENGSPHKTFTPQQHGGNDCLIHAINEHLPPAHQKSPQCAREYIACKITTEGHPCNIIVTSGIARNYYGIGYKGGMYGGYKRPVTTPRSYQFAEEEALGNDDIRAILEEKNALQEQRGGKMKLDYSKARVDLCHTLSAKGMWTIVNHCANEVNSKTGNRMNAIKILKDCRQTFFPTKKEIVIDKSSVYGESQEHKLYLKHYARIEKLEIKKMTAFIEKLENSNARPDKKSWSRVASLLANAKTNIRLGDRSKNRTIQQHFDGNPNSTRDENIKKFYLRCQNDYGIKGFESDKFDPKKSKGKNKHSFNFGHK